MGGRGTIGHFDDITAGGVHKKKKKNQYDLGRMMYDGHMFGVKNFTQNIV